MDCFWWCYWLSGAFREDIVVFGNSQVLRNVWEGEGEGVWPRNIISGPVGFCVF